MMDPKKICIEDYSYSLPEEKIAKFPLPERDASRVLIYREGNISEDIYKNIGRHLPSNSLIIFNNTKVVEARILFQKPTGGLIEVFCLEPGDQYPDVTSAMLAQGNAHWKCLIGGASKWKHGMTLDKKIKFSNGDLHLTARILEREADTFLIELKWNSPDLSFAEILHLAGAIPLPPYLRREVEESDAERYQTIYARESGSVAAPTAGLHFTESIFNSLAQKKIRLNYITLHVGAGTFKPVKSDTMSAHDMHAEFFEADQDLIHSLIMEQNVTAVGTTSARTLESLYWLGVKLMKNPSIQQHHLFLDQWEAYELPQNITRNDAMESLLTWMQVNRLEIMITKTKLLIAPGYSFRVINLLITNFHQPQSTLLLLVAAAAGYDWRKIYDYALSNDFRFLSYGDGCLIALGS
jgi:S-adenosylmethionine:tRNA ribosyltransferase-isomerase